MAKTTNEIRNVKRLARRRRTSIFPRTARSELRTFAFLGAISLTFWAVFTFALGRGMY